MQNLLLGLCTLAFSISANCFGKASSDDIVGGTAAIKNNDKSAKRCEYKFVWDSSKWCCKETCGENARSDNDVCDEKQTFFKNIQCQK